MGRGRLTRVFHHLWGIGLKVEGLTRLHSVWSSFSTLFRGGKSSYTDRGVLTRQYFTLDVTCVLHLERG